MRLRYRVQIEIKNTVDTEINGIPAFTFGVCKHCHMEYCLYLIDCIPSGNVYILQMKTFIECSQFKYRWHSLSQSEPDISISIWAYFYAPHLTTIKETCQKLGILSHLSGIFMFLQGVITSSLLQNVLSCLKDCCGFCE